MNDSSARTAGASGRQVSPSARRGGRVNGSAGLPTLILKELREILRDRRTLLTLGLMPLLVYPLLSVVLQRFLLATDVPENRPIVVFSEGQMQAGVAFLRLGADAADLPPELRRLEQDIFGLSGDGVTPVPDVATQESPASPALDPSLKRAGNPALVMPQFRLADVSESLAERVRLGIADAAVDIRARRRTEVETVPFPYLVRPADEDDPLTGDTAAAPRTDAVPTPGGVSGRRGIVYEIAIYERPGDLRSRQAVRFLTRLADALNRQALTATLARAGLPTGEPLTIRPVSVEPEADGTVPLAGLIPLVLLMMTITGAVYPAIDLTAGERERGTLEILMVSPAPRLTILLAKYVAVLAVAILTSAANLVGMTVVLVASPALASVLLGEGAITVATFAALVGLLVLFAAFFSAVLLSLTSLARSFKEAQAYLIPVMLLALLPGLISLFPGVELTMTTAILPLLGIVLLTRDLLQGAVDPVAALVTVLATGAYAIATLALAASVFGRSATIYGSAGGVGELFARPESRQRQPSAAAALLTLAIVFPLFAAASGLSARLGELDPTVRFLVSGSLTLVVFGVVPALILMWQRVSLLSLYRVNGRTLAVLPGAIVLALSLWPIATELVVLAHRWGLATIDADRFRQVAELASRLDAVPLWAILFALAIAPGLAEELCFRGLLQNGLTTALRRGLALIVAAVVFALFHVVGVLLTPERMLPTLMMGIVLGWVYLRSESLVPGTILHMIHNGLLLTANRLGWTGGDAPAPGPNWSGLVEAPDTLVAHVPLSWLGAAAAGVVVAIVWIGVVTRSPSRRPDPVE